MMRIEKGDSKMITVTAKNLLTNKTEEFELSARRITNTSYGLMYQSETRSQMRKVFLGKLLLGGFAWEVKQKGHSIRIGCMHFNPTETAKLRKWALAKPKGKR